MGDDLRVVNAARVSFNKESKWTSDQGYSKEVLFPRDEKLINYLASHNHWTPFSHPQITLRETIPIFVARQRFKHTVGFTYNEVSRRYVDEPPEFFSPKVWYSKSEDKKQGHGEPQPDIIQDAAYDLLADVHGVSLTVYKGLLNLRVCPEQARMVLPQSMYTSYYVTGSLAAWARAYKLRSSPDAQTEIQELAGQWNEILSPLFPVSWKALTNEGEAR